MNEFRTGLRKGRTPSAALPPDGNLVTSQYDADTRRTTLLLANGSKRRYAFDSIGRLTTQIELNASNNPIATFVDAYDAIGNRISRNQDGTLTTWTYDDLYRLLGQQTSGGYATFSYDSVSNVLVKWHQGGSPQSYTYDIGQRMVTMQEAAALTSYTYDNVGNLTLENVAGARTTNSYDPRTG